MICWIRTRITSVDEFFGFDFDETDACNRRTIEIDIIGNLQKIKILAKIHNVFDKNVSINFLFFLNLWNTKKFNFYVAYLTNFVILEKLVGNCRFHIKKKRK